MSEHIPARRQLRWITLLGAFVFLSIAPGVLVAANLPEDAPIVVSEPFTTRTLVTLTRRRGQPLSTVVPVGATATVYVTNLVELLKSEDATAFRADIEDSRHFRYPLEIISFQRTPERAWVYAVTFRLHPDLGDVGDALLRVTWRGMSSNRTRIAIGHEGGKIEEDAGSVPTPMPETPIIPIRAEVVGLPWTGDRVRFMMQAGFGPSTTMESRVRRLGYSTWLEEQFEQKYSGGDERFSTYPYPPFKPVQTTPPTDCNGTTGSGDPTDPDPLCFRNRYSMFPLQNWLFREALYGEDQQLRRRVSWALGQIFVVGGRETEQSGRMIEYQKILDRNAFGNFRTLLRDVTLSAVMGNYLDMARSTRQNPNENYAREILQLFTIGVDTLNPNGTPVLNQQGERVPTYTQSTVDNFTKVFTGWTFCNAAECPNATPGIVNYVDEMAVTPANHDNTEKTLFRGEIIPAGMNPDQELNRALDNVFYHPNVGPFISKILIQQMVTSNPTPAYVGRVAAIFNNNGTGIRGDLKAVVRAILLDPEARGNVKTDPDYGHLREPLLFVTNLLRPFGAMAQANAAVACNGQSDGILNSVTLSLDQDIYYPPTVFNYYPMDYVLPGTNLGGPEFGIMSTGTALKRPNFVNQFVAPNPANPVTPGIPVNTIQTNPAYAPCGTRIDMTRIQNLITADSGAGAAVDTLDREMLGGSMSRDMRDDILTAVNVIPSTNPQKRARTAIYLVATSPQFQVQR